jgi:hypothetical protein
MWSIQKITPPNMVHLTEKPVELAERSVRAMSPQFASRFMICSLAGSLRSDRGISPSFLLGVRSLYFLYPI